MWQLIVYLGGMAIAGIIVLVQWIAIYKEAKNNVVAFPSRYEMEVEIGNYIDGKKEIGDASEMG